MWLQRPELPNCETTTQTSNDTVVGGVSDGTRGAALQSLHSHDLSTVRSWAMFEEAIVASALRTSCTSDNPVVLTLASRVLNGSVTVGWLRNGTSTVLASGNYTFGAGDLAWVHHEQTLYTFLDEQGTSSHGNVFPLRVVLGKAVGNWDTIGVTNHSQTTAVFFLALLLGPQPASVATGYVLFPAQAVSQAWQAVVPAVGFSEAGAIYAQAYADGSRTAMATLVEAGTVALNATVAVGCNTSCLVVWTQFLNGSEVLSVSSPVASAVEVTVPGLGALAWVLPSGNFLGQTLTRWFPGRRAGAKPLTD